MSTVEVKTVELIGCALDWAHLTAMYGDGPDWAIRDGCFGVVYLEMVQTGLDAYGDVERFQEYRPRDLYGEEKVREIVAVKLGTVIHVPAELL